MTSTVLGFCTRAPQRAFLPARFPSKAGGRPVWLHRDKLPPVAPACGVCGQDVRFLLQLYAPVDGEASFHRIVYVFVCANEGCLERGGAGAVVVLRAQMARVNACYSFDASDESEGEETEDGVAEIVEIVDDVCARGECAVCGFRGEVRCGGCRGVTYCGRRCQRRDWSAGHREGCGSGGGSETGRSGAFEEFEIVNEDAPPAVEEDSESDGDGVEEEGEGVGGTFKDADGDEMPEEMFRKREHVRTDAVFERFSREMAQEPDQVVRYCRGGDALWAGRTGQCADTGVCETCGADRVFEFQVLPQLLYYLERGGRGGESIAEVAKRLRDGLDWATIGVFCCGSSCEGAAYVREMAWLQRHK